MLVLTLGDMCLGQAADQVWFGLHCQFHRQIILKGRVIPEATATIARTWNFHIVGCSDGTKVGTRRELESRQILGL
jgi:hypothetical protein